MDWVDNVIRIWNLKGIKLQEGASQKKIADIEDLLKFSLPKDFVALYTKANGFENFDWNEHMFSLWSIERILDEYIEDNNPNYIGFCDYLINSHSIGFLKRTKGIFKSYDQTKSICNTFQEAIELMNSGSGRLY